MIIYAGLLMWQAMCLTVAALTFAVAGQLLRVAVRAVRR